MNAHDRDVMDRQIHRARLESLQDEPPELGETLGEYVDRMDRRFGTTYHEAAIERYQGAAKREAHAETSARELLAKIARK